MENSATLTATQAPTATGSQLFSVYPVLGALSAGSVLFGGKPLRWQPNTDAQAVVTTLLREHGEELAQVLGLESKADFNVDVINAFLREKGFDIQLTPARAPGGFAVASVYDMLALWVDTATQATVHTEDGKDYAGFKHTDYSEVYGVYGHDNPIIQIGTKSGVEMFFTAVDTHPGSGFELAAFVRKLSELRDRRHLRESYAGAILPCVSFDQQNDISFLEGMAAQIEGEAAIISQAIMQSRFRMNEHGARMQAAAAIYMTRGISRAPEPYVLNRAFAFWCKRPGISLPTFVGYIEPEDWKNPGDITALK